MAFEMSERARRLSEAGIRHRHPDWTDAEVHQAMLELLLGADLARKLRAGQRTRA